MNPKAKSKFSTLFGAQDNKENENNTFKKFEEDRSKNNISNFLSSQPHHSFKLPKMSSTTKERKYVSLRKVHLLEHSSSRSLTSDSLFLPDSLKCHNHKKKYSVVKFKSDPWRDEDDHDFTLIFEKEAVKLLCHKAIMENCSFFKAICNMSWAISSEEIRYLFTEDKRKPTKGKMELLMNESDNYRTFTCKLSFLLFSLIFPLVLIEFIYGKKLFLDSHSVAQLYVLADKICFKEMLLYCREYMAANLNYMNISKFYNLALAHNEEVLIFYCRIFIIQNAEIISSSSQEVDRNTFLQITKAKLCDVITL